jgi:aspartate dehydrogenase
VLTLGLLGGGSIAAAVAESVAAGEMPGVRIVAIAGASSPPSARVERLAELVGCTAVAPEGLIAAAPDWVLEAAGGAALTTQIVALLDAGIGVVAMSIGALLDEKLWREVEQRRERGARVVLPSGAIGGLDVVAALNARGRLTEAGITSTKAPAGLRGAPYLEDHGIVLPDDRAVTVFRGNALEAIAGFPANVNVAAALSLAGLGPQRTTVTIVSDPAAARTRHEIVAAGDGGRVRVEIEALPNPSNPKSSYLAALSAVATLKTLVEGERGRGGADRPVTVS